MAGLKVPQNTIIEIERLTANVYVLRMGKIARITMYPRDAEALEAVGLSE